MNDDLKQDLLHSLFYFKKAMGAISRFLANAGDGGLSVAELSALNCIERGGEKDRGAEEASRPADKTAHHAMHKTLAVSKAAVSQMLGSLEKRDYIRRDIDRDNRRKIIITVTEKGKTSIGEGKKRMDALMSRIITRLGREDARRFALMLNRFAEGRRRGDRKDRRAAGVRLTNRQSARIGLRRKLSSRLRMWSLRSNGSMPKC